MIHKKYAQRICGLALVLFSTAHAQVFFNVMRPHEYLLEHKEWPLDTKYMITALVEHGLKGRGFTMGHCHVGELQAWNADQNALKMLEGFPPTSPIGLLSAQLGGLDDGVRGHFDVCGKLRMNYLVGIGALFKLPYNFSVGFSLPFCQAELEDVVWKEKTLNLTEGDLLVKSQLTNNFFENVQELGGLNLQGWKRSGVGDMTALAMWQQDFAQKRPILKNVRLDARVGFNLPTGRRVDENVIVSVPFGQDGAVGIIWGGGITTTLGCYLKVGGDVELMHLFGNTRCRRIKTEMDQTELLLLATTPAHKSYGLTQCFNLHAQIYQFWGGLSAGFTYQFLKRGDDTLTLCNLEYSEAAANSANEIQQREVQTLIFEATYDMAPCSDRCDRVIPEFSLYYRMPFKGENAIVTHSVGVGIGLRF